MCNDTAAWSDDDQRFIAALPGVVQTDFRRSLTIFLSADREPVTLLARDMRRRLKSIRGDSDSGYDSEHDVY